ncbi:MAG: phosphoribosyl-AMP cyclohydrolase [Actinomycetes bacterium]|jgi:phosphoribosyl-AMP cyclohydrolase
MNEFDFDVTEIKWNSQGLVPAIVQEGNSGEVLMLAWVNKEALEITRREGLATYWSRSREELWTKGATSGHFQRVTRISLDCDGDTLLYQVEQEGVACHTGERTCFIGRNAHQ